MKILCVHPGASFSTADVWRGLSGAMERAGVTVVHYALENRMNAAADWLRLCWEHNAKQTPEPKLQDSLYFASSMVLERALRHEVDWVFIVSGIFVHPEAITLYRRAGLRVAILFTESPYDDEWQLALASLADLCWVNDTASLDAFRAVQPATYYYQHAYDPALHHTGEHGIAVRAHDVVFVGTAWRERIALFKAIDWSGIDLGLYGAWNDLLPEGDPLWQHVAGSITDNATTAALYQQAKIGINLHRRQKMQGGDDASGNSLNPRCYELAACGAFFVSDFRPELADVFGSIVPVFSTPAELQEIIGYYLAHDDERQSIAAQLPGLVAGHTFDARVRDILGRMEV